MFTPKYSARDQQPGQSNTLEAASTFLLLSSGGVGGHSIPKPALHTEGVRRCGSDLSPPVKCPRHVTLRVTFSHVAQKLPNTARGHRSSAEWIWTPKKSFLSLLSSSVLQTCQQVSPTGSMQICVFFSQWHTVMSTSTLVSTTGFFSLCLPPMWAKLCLHLKVGVPRCCGGANSCPISINQPLILTDPVWHCSIGQPEFP